MTDDLVTRLRTSDIYDYDTANAICVAAADRIEELEAALRKIADPVRWEGMDWISHGVPKWIARAALEKTSEN